MKVLWKCDESPEKQWETGSTWIQTGRNATVDCSRKWCEASVARDPPLRDAWWAWHFRVWSCWKQPCDPTSGGRLRTMTMDWEPKKWASLGWLAWHFNEPKHAKTSASCSRVGCLEGSTHQPSGIKHGNVFFQVICNGFHCHFWSPGVYQVIANFQSWQSPGVEAICFEMPTAIDFPVQCWWVRPGPSTRFNVVLSQIPCLTPCLYWTPSFHCLSQLLVPFEEQNRNLWSNLERSRSNTSL